MTSYAKKERARYWPVSKELLEQYLDGSHTSKNIYGLYWQNQNDKFHRDGDKPSIIGWDGRLIWYQNGDLYRDGDKPARINSDGTLAWYQNSQEHRICGPAVINSDGTLEWWINGENITQEVKKWLNKKHWRGTPEQIFEFQLRFL